MEFSEGGGEGAFGDFGAADHGDAAGAAEAFGDDAALFAELNGGVDVDGTFGDLEIELHFSGAVADGEVALVAEGGVDLADVGALALGEFGGHADGGRTVIGSEGGSAGGAAGEKGKGCGGEGGEE